MSNQRTSSGTTGSVAAVFAGGVSALLFAYALAHAQSLPGIFVSYLTAMPLFLVGLGAGSAAGLMAAAVGTVGLLVTLPSNIAVLYTFLFAAPSAALSALALRYRRGDDGTIHWYPEGYLTTALAVYPGLIFAAMATLSLTHPGGLLDITTGMFTSILHTAAKDARPETVAVFRDALPLAAKFAPAIFSLAWYFVIGLSLFVGQAVLEKQGWNIRTFSWLSLRAPRWVLAAFAAATLLSLLQSPPHDYYSVNAASILGLPFFCVGLTIIHAWAATTKIQTLLLVIFYIVLSVIIWTVFLVTLLGVVDQWIDVRRRWLQPKPSV